MTDTHPSLNRRTFLKAAAASSAAFILSRSAVGADSTNPARLARRKYGKHPEELSIVGLGGVSIKGLKDQDHVNRLVARAWEMGVNLYDVAPAYGNAQEIMGPALQPYRKNAFLACKTNKRDAEAARAELKRSLELLKTDHFDLYQFHHVRSVKEEVDVIFGKGGAMEVFQEAKKDGRIRYLGFSAHTVEAALEMLRRYPFDSIMFPINFASFFKGDFGPTVLKLADEQGLAKLAIKPLCRQDWPRGADRTGGRKWTKMWYQPITDKREAELAMKWALGTGVTTMMPPGEEDMFWLAVETALGLRTPLTEPELEEIKQLATRLTPTFRADKITLAPTEMGIA